LDTSAEATTAPHRIAEIVSDMLLRIAKTATPL
jgi:hypothetical protein